jgi:predicted flavoprotein YhiN
MQLFSLDTKHMSTDLHFKGFRPWEEAKVTWWGISLDELTTSFESKKVPGLYFLGELLDITWRSGGYNLQWARSSAYVCWSNVEC